ncbi:MAG: hypothetical protein M5U09_01490 [Gammaproteobacteria bacterium]|nr:hypothetical protein [Gammaproteobacteria bacterium]
MFSPDAVCSPDDTTRAKGHAYQLRRMLLAADPGAAFLDSPILHGVVTQDCATLSDGSLLCWSYANSASRPGPAIADSERQPVLRTWRPGASADEMPQRPKLFANSAMQAFVGRFFVLASHGSLTLTWWPEATQDGVFAVLGYRDELFEASGFDLDWLAELVGIELGTARPRFNWWLSRVPITAASPVRPDRYTCWREGPGANRRLHCGDFGETVPSWRPLARLDEDARKVLLGVVGRGDAANLFERLADTGQDARVLAVDGGQLDDMALLVEKQTGEMAWISPYRPETPALWISPSVPGIAEEDEPRVPFDAVADTQEKRIALRLQADAHRAGAERIYLRIAAGTPDSGRRNHIVHAEMPGCHRLRRTDPGYPLETQWHDLGTLRVRQVQSIPEALRRTAVQGESEPQRFLRCLTADPAEQAHTCDVFNPRALLQPGARSFLDPRLHGT